MTTYEHLDNAAGVSKILFKHGIETKMARANSTGAQIVINHPIPAQLQEHIESRGEHGELLFGCWVKEVKHDN